MFRRFFTWLIGLFIHEAVEQVKEEIKKPDVVKDENTPKKIRDGFNDYLSDKLRGKGNNGE